MVSITSKKSMTSTHNCIFVICPAALRSVISGGCLRTPLLVIFYGQASRPISTGKLNALLRLHTRPINVVVYNGPSGDCSRGYLILKEASRLDAFSGYPFRT
jgi:hypothetical protein